MLITGASSGIGRELALLAARAGYAVYAIGRKRDALDALAAEIAAAGGTVAVEAVDISDPGNARGVIARVLAQFSTLDVLVNNAGFVSAGNISIQSNAELERQFGTHVIGPLALVREALAALRDVHGCVFMLGSGVARVPVGGLGAYPPAKAATRSATAILRRELRPLGIGVTYVDPGAVDTPFMQRAGMPGAPARLLTSPKRVAQAILDAVVRRPANLNVVPWQAFAVALAQAFPAITELVLERAPGLVGGMDPPPILLIPEKPAVTPPTTAIAAPAPAPASASASASDAEPPPTGLAAALAPVRHRMERLKLREEFVRGLLVPGALLDPNEVAMRWAGMPNKNERAVTDEVLDALVDGGYVRPTGGAFAVIKGAD
jgi:short-subunit dehydrogenase